MVECCFCSCAKGSESLFEFRPCLFNRVEVRRVRRQVEHGCSARLDPFAYAFHFVGAEVVHHHDMARPQFWAEHLIEVRQEDFAIGGCLDGHGGQHAAVVHRAQDGDDLPVASGHGGVHAPATPGTGVDTRHLCRYAAFVQVNQVFGRDLAEPLDERPAPDLIGFGISLRGVDRLFLSRRPNCFTTLAMCARLIACPAR